MNKNKRSISILVAITMLGLAILACGPNVTPSTQPQNTPASSSNPNSNPNPSRPVSHASLISAAVQIFGAKDENGKLTPVYVGSGSIISSNGLILTNAHVADPAAVGETDMTPDALIIGIVQSEDKPPVYAYQAKVRAIDGYADLAVIQITSTIDGGSLDPASLNLPYVALGNSDDVHIGDAISVYGFPLIGGNTITYTAGTVAGFNAEDQLGDRAWIKTSATISGGNSGGMAVNADGELIGVPSIASSGANTETTDCRVIQDTNGDGRIDNNDTCIPIGGFINALRPINLAMPLIKSAESGMAYNSPYSSEAGQQGSSESTGSEQMSEIQWFTVDDKGNLGDQVNSYPHGTTVLVAMFSFSGFTDGETWSESWSSGGQEVYSDTYSWDQGTDGVYGTTLGNQGDPIPDGTYHLELFAGTSQDPLTQSDVVVGRASGPGNSQPGSMGSAVQLSGTITDSSSGNPIQGAYVFALNSGITYDDWSSSDYSQDDIFTYTKTDANGKYTLPAKLSRNTPYTIVVAAEGYYDQYGDNLIWTDQDPSNYTMDISMGQ
jgi:serine protease Do